MALTIEQQEQINNWFKFHPVINDQAERYEAIRDVTGKRLAKALLSRDTEEVTKAIDAMERTINQCCPDSLEKEFALRNLGIIYDFYSQGHVYFTLTILRFSVIMPANAALACNEQEAAIDM